MSRYSEKPLTFEGLKTVPIDARGGKFASKHFARPYAKGGGIARMAGFAAEDHRRQTPFAEWWRLCGAPATRSARFSGAWAATW